MKNDTKKNSKSVIIPECLVKEIKENQNKLSSLIGCKLNFTQTVQYFINWGISTYQDVQDSNMKVKLEELKKQC